MKGNECVTVKQLIMKALAQLEKNDLERLYEIIKTLIKEKKSMKKASLLKSLSNIKIEAPADFAENHEECQRYKI